MAKVKSISISIAQAKEIVRLLAKYEETRCAGCAGFLHDTGCPALRAYEIQDDLRRSINNPTYRHARFCGLRISDAWDAVGILENYAQSICHGCPDEEHLDSCPARKASQLKSDLEFLMEHSQNA